MNYNTVGKRRNASKEVLDEINNYNGTIDNLKKGGAMLVKSLLDSSMDDYSNRQTTVNCAQQIYGSLSELSKLRSVKINIDLPHYYWIVPVSMNALNYVWGVDELTDNNGNYISSTFKDVSMPWQLFKSFSDDRDRELKKLWREVYDDYIVNTRTIFESKNIYGDVVKDVSVSLNKNWLGSVTGVSANKSYKTVVQDTETIQIDTSPEPKLPTKNDFLDLATLTSNETDNISFWADYAKTFLVKQDDKTFDYLTLKMNDFYNDKQTINSSTDFLIDEANEKLKEITGVLYFKKDSHYILAQVVSKKIVESKKVIKDEYKVFYENSTKLVNNKVYQDFSKYYFDTYYKIELEVKYLDDNGAKATDLFVAQSYVDDINNLPVIKTIFENVYSLVKDARSIYKSNPQETRAEDFEPSVYYENFYNYLYPLSITNSTQAKMFLNYLVDTIEPWCKKREVALWDTIDDEKNIDKFLTSLKKRLNKNTGSLMLWYQSILAFDDSVRDLVNVEKIAKYTIQDLIVGKCCEDDDSSLSRLQASPDYIDIDPLDPLYGNRKFNAGDTVYLEDDYHPEFGPVKINSIKKVAIKISNITSFSQQELEETGTIVPTYDTKVISRLYLNAKLPYYFCNENDVSSLRVVKIDK